MPIIKNMRFITLAPFSNFKGYIFRNVICPLQFELARRFKSTGAEGESAPVLLITMLFPPVAGANLHNIIYRNDKDFSISGSTLGFSNHAYNVGNTTSVKSVEVINPPMTTVASGR